jgi:hypothetical protein
MIFHNYAGEHGVFGIHFHPLPRPLCVNRLGFRCGSRVKWKVSKRLEDFENLLPFSRRPHAETYADIEFEYRGCADQNGDVPIRKLLRLRNGINIVSHRIYEKGRVDQACLQPNLSVVRWRRLELPSLIS